MTSAATRWPTSAKVFAACGAWLVALGFYFLFLRPALLPEDPRYMGSSIELVRACLPGLERWLGHVFNVMGGFMVASGVTTIVVARHLAERARGALLAMAVAGGAGVGLMSVTNFALHSDFRWLLVLPPLLWFTGLVCYLREGATPQARMSHRD